MVTYAQAQELAEDWINGGVPRSGQREVRVREFDLGFVCWSVGPVDGPVGDGCEARLVIARDTGASTLWPALPVNEVVRQYEEVYGRPVAANPAGAARPAPGAVEATSFLLSPPQWLQEAGAAAIAAEAARLGGTEPAGSEPTPAPAPVAAPAPAPAPVAAPAPAPAPVAAPAPVPVAAGPGQDRGPAVLSTPPPSDRPAGGAPTMLAPPPAPLTGAPVPAAPYGAGPGGGVEPATVRLPDGLPAGSPPPPGATPAFPVPAPAAGGYAPTVLAPPGGLPGLSGPAGAAAPPSVDHAPTMLASPDALPGLMGLPGAPETPPSATPPQASGRSGASAPPPPPPAGLRGGPPADPAAPVGGRGTGSPPPPPPADLRHAPGAGPVAAAAGRAAGGSPPPPPPGLRGASPAPAPPAPAPQAAPGGGVAYEATQLAHAVELPGGPGGPGSPASGVPSVGYGYPGAGSPAAQGPAAPPPAAVPPPAPGPQGAPLPPGVPAVGPGYFAALSYRAPDGSEQKLLQRSEPGTPHPEWKILQELRRLNVPPEQVLELYTELESCDLPGGYCARMIQASWPNVRLTHTAGYGRDHQARQGGMAQLLDHLDELHQLASAPRRPRPVRVPLPGAGSVPPLPPLAPQQLAAELGQAFGPAVFRFEQRAVSRQGVPEPVAQTLMWAGLPRDFGPFFWAQAQEGRPIPTLAELAVERGLQGGPDFGGYLVLGNDYGRQLCVQYGTAAVVAVDLEGGGEPPRFVNSGVPEFVRALALLGRMWRLRFGLTPEQAGRWTTDFQAQLAAIDPAALQTADTWWAVLLEQFWDGLL